MKHSILIFTLGIALYAGGCGQRGTGGAGNQEDRPVQYVQVEVFEQENNCDTSQHDCTRIYLSYPRIVSSVSSTLNDTLCPQIDRWLTGGEESEGEKVSPESFAKSFIQDYEKFREEFPDAPGKWFIHRKIEVLANNERFVTLQLSEENYMGGAHGMNLHLFANFRTEGGERIELSDLVLPEKMKEFERKAEELFRIEREIPEGTSLQDAGYFYMNKKGSENPFHLTENFAITREGLLFYYNPYDIAPYYMGATILKVPFREVRTTLKQNGLLTGFAESE